MSQTRGGKGALYSKLTGAALRAAGRRGNQTQSALAEARRNIIYNDVVPF